MITNIFTIIAIILIITWSLLVLDYLEIESTIIDTIISKIEERRFNKLPEVTEEEYKRMCREYRNK